MADEILLHGTAFAERGSVGFGIAYVKNRDDDPLVGVVAVDIATGEEARHKVRCGELFKVAGQTWQVVEVRYPPGVKREVLLRRVA